MSDKPTTARAYLDSLDPERRAAIATVRDTILSKLPEGYEEAIEFGMLAYVIPLSRYPATYNKRPLQIAALAAQKNYMSLYLVGVYADPKVRAWFEGAFEKAGKKLDMGKSCVRFESLDDLPLEVVGEAIGKVSVEQYIARYEAARASVPTTRPVPKKAPAKKTSRGR